ncbi:MAG: DUF4174 domain-containing protein [Cyclobacteriaceae bacterium]
MKISYVLLTMVMFTTQFPTFAQNLDEFRWKNRIIVVYAGDSDNEQFTSQIALLESSLPELKERKLILLKADDHRITDQYNQRYDAALHEELRELKKEGSGFEILLIGLDGGVKMRKTKVVERSEIFGLIDTMPMRRAEMDHDKK